MKSNNLFGNDISEEINKMAADLTRVWMASMKRRAALPSARAKLPARLAMKAHAAGATEVVFSLCQRFPNLPWEAKHLAEEYFQAVLAYLAKEKPIESREAGDKIVLLCLVSCVQIASKMSCAQAVISPMDIHCSFPEIT